MKWFNFAKGWEASVDVGSSSWTANTAAGLGEDLSVMIHEKLLTRADYRNTTRFLQLPRELRNMLYEIVTVTDVQSLSGSNMWSWVESSRPGLDLAIISTCKQIDCEAEKMLFQHNAICLRFDLQGSRETWEYRGGSEAIVHGLNGRGNDVYDYHPPNLITYSFQIQKLRRVTIDLLCRGRVGGDEESLYSMVKNTASYLLSC